MKKNETQPGVELLISPSAIVRERTGIDNDVLTRTVQEKVAEIMAERDAVVFEPFFRSRRVAYELKRPLKWDAVKEEFPGDEEANRFLDRAKREPWQL